MTTAGLSRESFLYKTAFLFDPHSSPLYPVKPVRLLFNGYLTVGLRGWHNLDVRMRGAKFRQSRKNSGLRRRSQVRYEAVMTTVGLPRESFLYSPQIRP